MKFCGPKFSICCTVLSAWAIIQLGLMGLFFLIKSPALIEDLYIPDDTEETPAAFIEAMEASYSQTAINCWIATGMYVVSFVVSGWQMWLNLKSG